MRNNIGLLLVTEPQDGGQHQYAMLVVQSLLKRAGTEYNLVAFCGNTFWKKWCKKRNIRYLGYQLPALTMKEQIFNYQHPLLAKVYYTYMTTFGKKIMEEKIDLLFSTHQGIFLPNYKVKIIAPVHDLMHRYEPKFPEVRDSYVSREITMKCFAKYAACVLVDSKLGRKQFKESYIDEGNRRIGRLYIESLPYAVPKHILEIEEEYIEVPNKYIFYPAQFWKHKNHINLVKALKILKEDIPDIHLVLVGSEKNSCNEIKKYITVNGLWENVTLLGFVSDGSVVYLYKHAVCMVMPSYFGPTNMPPLEAMALGCPVAVSNKYAMPEQVGKAGILFDPDSPEEIAECIKLLWLNEGLRQKMQEVGYKRVRKFTEHVFEEGLCRIIHNIVTKEKKGKR